MQKTPKLLVVIGGLCLLLIVGLFWSGSKKPADSENATSSSPTMPKDKASGDNENEVLRTVLANQEQLKSENKALKEQNEQLQQKGMQSVDNLVQNSKQTLQDEIQTIKSTLEKKIDTQEKTIAHLKNDDGDAGNGSGAEGFEINGEQSWSQNEPGSKPHVITTVADLSTSINGGKNVESQSGIQNIPASSLSQETQNTQNAPSLPSDQDPSKDSKIPYYTIPANSTLNHVKLMTSIIGEVPISGKLVAPAFPFKAIISKKELYAANGMSLPSDLSGTVIQGYSVGNMTLSCARLYVTRMLFVFNDGHFVVYPNEDDNEAATNLYPTNALGYLSDSYGNTCLSGKYITDAPKVLTNLALLGGISTSANAVASSQFTTVNNGQNLTAALTGSMPKLVGASMMSGGSEEVLEWYKARVDDVFDAIYIPASFQHRPTNLVFNTTKTIPIDLNKNGRTLRYENINALSNHFSHLD